MSHVVQLSQKPAVALNLRFHALRIFVVYLGFPVDNENLALDSVRGTLSKLGVAFRVGVLPFGNDGAILRSSSLSPNDAGVEQLLAHFRRLRGQYCR